MNNFQNFGIENGICNNYAMRGFNAVYTQNNKKLFAMNFNLQCFNAKIDEFSAFLHELNLPPKILCLTETWFASHNTQNIDSYKPFHSTRNEEHEHGGVSIFVLDSLPVKCTEVSSRSLPELEYIHVRLNFTTKNAKKLDVVGMYRPSGASLPDFFSSLEIALSNIVSTNDLIIMGDFNICGLVPSPSLDNYIDLMCSFGLMPHIDKVTRPNPRGEDTLLDHTWSNFGFNFESGVFNEILISDHYISFTFFPLDLSTEKKNVFP